MPFSLKAICDDPLLSQNVTIIRSQGGQFGSGGFKPAAPVNIPARGVLEIADSKRMQMVPEGDRITGSIEFITKTRVYTTSEALEGISDQIQWRGNMYRVTTVAQWGDFGFWSATLVRMTGS